MGISRSRAASSPSFQATSSSVTFAGELRAMGVAIRVRTGRRCPDYRPAAPDRSLVRALRLLGASVVGAFARVLAGARAHVGGASLHHRFEELAGDVHEVA